ncbi:hypothetical protein [Paraburkholderia sp. J76]|uniref:hypothetical protein n=1 Tax=Paraburkholderia sp. J76 TaxID=2805439 RepID=UPI002ABE941C|nr:hypothetical protein [Paraburkholderia sp. J76]
MNKATGTLIAAAAVLALSGSAYAQTAPGMGNSGSSTTPGAATNPMNDTSSGYGMPGVINSDAGSAPPNSPLRQSMNPDTATHTSGPTSNNSLATPSVKSPGAQ